MTHAGRGSVYGEYAGLFADPRVLAQRSGFSPLSVVKPASGGENPRLSGQNPDLS